MEEPLGNLGKLIKIKFKLNMFVDFEWPGSAHGGIRLTVVCSCVEFFKCVYSCLKQLFRVFVAVVLLFMLKYSCV